MVRGMCDYLICPHANVKNDNFYNVCDCLSREMRERYMFRFHNNQSGCKNPNHEKFGKHNVWYLAQVPTWKDSCFVPLTNKEDQENLEKICRLYNIVCNCEHAFQSCKLCHFLSNNEEPPKLYVSQFERWSLKELLKLFPYIDWNILEMRAYILKIARLFSEDSNSSTSSDNNSSSNSSGDSNSDSEPDSNDESNTKNNHNKKKTKNCKLCLNGYAYHKL
jgi:hypothetical protein